MPGVDSYTDVLENKLKFESSAYIRWKHKLLLSVEILKINLRLDSDTKLVFAICRNGGRGSQVAADKV